MCCVSINGFEQRVLYTAARVIFLLHAATIQDTSADYCHRQGGIVLTWSLQYSLQYETFKSTQKYTKQQKRRTSYSGTICVIYTNIKLL